MPGESKVVENLLLLPFLFCPSTLNGGEKSNESKGEEQKLLCWGAAENKFFFSSLPSSAPGALILHFVRAA